MSKFKAVYRICHTQCRRDMMKLAQDIDMYNKMKTQYAWCGKFCNEFCMKRAVDDCVSSPNNFCSDNCYDECFYVGKTPTRLLSKHDIDLLP